MKEVTVAGTSFNLESWKGLSEKDMVKKANDLGIFPDMKGVEREKLVKEAHGKLKSLSGGDPDKNG